MLNNTLQVTQARNMSVLRKNTFASPKMLHSFHVWRSLDDLITLTDARE